MKLNKMRKKRKFKYKKMFIFKKLLRTCIVTLGFHLKVCYNKIN